MTTPERADFLRPAFEGAPHFILDPDEGLPLFNTLANISVAGGSIVVLDEAHFVTVDVMTEGIRRFLDDPSTANSSVRLIVVASSRKPPDPVLDFLVSYCDLYDIIYDCAGVEITNALMHLLKKPASRFDTLALRTWRKETSEQDEEAEVAVEAEAPSASARPSGEVTVELGDAEAQHQTLSIPATDGPIHLDITLKVDVSEAEDN